MRSPLNERENGPLVWKMFVAPKKNLIIALILVTFSFFPNLGIFVIGILLTRFIWLIVAWAKNLKW
jgi:hypothetical protein